MAKNYVKANVIPAKLISRINSLKRGSSVIKGSLSVAPGHDYWWFLVYGTGQFHEDPDGELNEPSSVSGEEAEGDEYEITVADDSDATVLVYMTKAGKRKRRYAVTHPGIYPIGFLRTSLFEAELFLKGQLTRAEKRAKKWDELPGREALVKIVNSVMAYLLDRLRANTPEDNDPDPYHEGRRPIPLADAWRITKAK